MFATELGKQLALRGHTVSFISYSAPLRLVDLPPRVTFHEVEAGEYPLLKQYPYTLALAAKMVEVATANRLQVLHVHYAIPFSPAAILARQMAPELNLQGGDHAARHRHVAGRRRALLPPGNPLLDRAVRRRHHRVGVSAQGDRGDVSGHPSDRGHPQLRGSRSLPPRRERRYGGKKLVLHISNFREVKRATDVIRVFARALAPASKRAWCWSATVPT